MRCFKSGTFVSALGVALTVVTIHFPAAADGSSNEDLRERNTDTSVLSPARRIRRDEAEPERTRDRRVDEPSIDGAGNNESRSEDNAAHTPLRRALDSDYADGTDEMAGAHRPSAREISNAVFSQTALIPNDNDATDFVWQWGQFIDHDIDLTDGTNPPEPVDIAVPVGDAWFDPDGSGDELISFNRSLYEHDGDGVRQQINEITGWIDGSGIYGSDATRAAALRRLDGSGKLLTSPGELLPFNSQGLANAGGDSDRLFLAGDVRANEQVGLTAMHTLFVREHNRWVDVLLAENPDLDGEALYQRARGLVTAELQIITYEEFLPVLLGGRLPRSGGYDPATDARILNEFSTAAFRLGHSMLSPTLLRLDETLQEADAGHLPLREGFFAPQEIQQHGIETLLRGLSRQLAQRIDAFVIDDVRNFLFGQPGDGGFDLVSLNIQRGRDHGLPSYNAARVGFGLEPALAFEDVSSDPEVVARLRSVYAHVDDIDFWVGGVAEDRLPDAMLGELFANVITAQFAALRDGDRFWHTRHLSDRDVRRVRSLRLADIIRMNTGIGEEIQDDVFRLGDAARNRTERGTRRR